MRLFTYDPLHTLESPHYVAIGDFITWKPKDGPLSGTKACPLGKVVSIYSETLDDNGQDKPNLLKNAADDIKASVMVQVNIFIFHQMHKDVLEYIQTPEIADVQLLGLDSLEVPMEHVPVSEGITSDFKTENQDQINAAIMCFYSTELIDKEIFIDITSRYNISQGVKRHVSPSTLDGFLEYPAASDTFSFAWNTFDPSDPADGIFKIIFDNALNQYIRPMHRNSRNTPRMFTKVLSKHPLNDNDRSLFMYTGAIEDMQQDIQSLVLLSQAHATPGFAWKWIKDLSTRIELRLERHEQEIEAKECIDDDSGLDDDLDDLVVGNDVVEFEEDAGDQDEEEEVWGSDEDDTSSDDEYSEDEDDEDED